MLRPLDWTFMFINIMYLRDGAWNETGTRRKQKRVQNRRGRLRTLAKVPLAIYMELVGANTPISGNLKVQSGDRQRARAPWSSRLKSSELHTTTTSS